jgi:hypothetical protein
VPPERFGGHFLNSVSKSVDTRGITTPFFLGEKALYLVSLPNHLISLVSLSRVLKVELARDRGMCDFLGLR